MINLGQSDSRILDEKTVKITFSLTLTFYLTNTRNRTKKSYAQL